MPGTTRYSATFDRTYEEEEEENDLPAEPPPTRRSRSQSVGQVGISLSNGRPYTPLGGAYNPHARSSSSGPKEPPKGTEVIPTRTVGKATVKAHSNPFQFVKVGTCPLYKKAEEQLKKVKEVKKQEVFKEEEEEWQSNLDSWKSRRRKMSESALRRQEELRQLLEMDEQTVPAQSKKIKTFSEMVEERAHRGRTLSLCLISSPFNLEDWNFSKETSNESDNNSNDNQQSADSSVINSEDDCDVFRSSENGTKNVINGVKCKTDIQCNKKRTDVINNGHTKTSNCDSKSSELDMSQESNLSKDDPNFNNSYIDSGLESLSSSHRAGDIQDSGSDFSQDSGSSLDSESPRVSGLITHGVELLEEFGSKEEYVNKALANEKFTGMELILKMSLIGNKFNDYGFTVTGGKDRGSAVFIASVEKGSVSDNVGLKVKDQILAINDESVSSLSYSAVSSLLNKSKEVKHLKLLLWRSATFSTKEGHVSVCDSQLRTGKDNLCMKKVQNSDAEMERNGADVVSQNNFENAISEKTSEANITKEAFKNIASESIIDSSSNYNERSIESENEMFVDDFEELARINNAKLTEASNATQVHTPSVSNNSQPSYNCLQAGDSSLNIIYQSNISSSNTSKDKDQLLSTSSSSKALIDEIPVEKVAEEMEKLILQQLEEEEQAKEKMKAGSTVNGNFSSEQLLNDVEEPHRHVEPPKEKPPPPPSSNNCQKAGVKRMNSTKRIKKEIQKRRSNFLGIDQSEEDENAADELSIPPPPALEDILKAERELDRKVNASLQRSLSVEAEIMRKEQEIIDNLEKEEQVKITQSISCENISTHSSNEQLEEKWIKKLKEEKKKLNEEQVTQEEQRNRLDDVKLLKEREVMLRKQEPSDGKCQSVSLPKQNSSDSSDKINESNKSETEAEKSKKIKYIRRKVKVVSKNITENVTNTNCSQDASKSTEKNDLKRTDNNSTSSGAGVINVQTVSENSQKLKVIEPKKNNVEDLVKNNQINKLSGSNKDSCVTVVAVPIMITSDASSENEYSTEKIKKAGKKATNGISAHPISVPDTNVAELLSGSLSSSSSPSFSIKSNSLPQSGDGENANKVVSAPSSESSKTDEPVAPVVQKPHKNKEVLRKERERLRLEQEALQKEREEYRRKLQLEQEQIKQSMHNPHVSDAPASQVGPLPPAKPILPSPLTSPPHKPTKRVGYDTSRRNQGGIHGGSVSQSAVSQHDPQSKSNHNPPVQTHHNKMDYSEGWSHHKVPVVRKQSDSTSESRYNQNHWLIQEAEMRRIAEQKERQRVQMLATDCSKYLPSTQIPYSHTANVEEISSGNVAQLQNVVHGQPFNMKSPNYVHGQMPEQQWNCAQPVHPSVQSRQYPVSSVPNAFCNKTQSHPAYGRNLVDHSQQPPTKPSRVLPTEKQEQMLSVSGRKRCSHCGEELGHGAAMIIESLQLYYHIHCFRCCVCQAQLGNGSCGTDVRVRNNKLHCQNCYSNDEAGLKFSQV